MDYDQWVVENLNFDQPAVDFYRSHGYSITTCDPPDGIIRITSCDTILIAVHFGTIAHGKKNIFICIFSIGQVQSNNAV